jgi:hypothetical protein
MVSTGVGFSVDTDQLRTHANHVQEVKDRFAAVKDASAHISGDEAAYGLLCGWISAVLEGRHARQDELLVYLEENLSIVIDRLGATATAYDSAEADSDDAIRFVNSKLGGDG